MFRDIRFKMTGSIGDLSRIQVDFANKDIGFGVTGTQEEILFGKHPELCVSMLFVDTLQDDEAIIVYNCRKVADFEGYGLNLKFKSVVQPNKNEQLPIIVAIDAMDFSEGCIDSENLFSIARVF